MTVELEKRYTYIQKFFESLSDEEFVRMMIECGIKSSKKPDQSNGLHRNNIYINSYCNILHMLF